MLKKKKKVELLSVAHREGRLEPFSSHLALLRAQKVYSSASICVLVYVFKGRRFAFILQCSLALSLYIMCVCVFIFTSLLHEGRRVS